MIKGSATVPRRPLRAPLRMLLRTGLLRAVALVLGAGFTLVSTRVLIEEVGAEAFGAIAMVSTLGALLAFADLGAGAAITNALAHPTSDSDRARIMLSSLRALALGGTIIGAAGIVLALFDLWDNVLGQGVRGLAGVNTVCPLVLILFGLTVVAGAGQRALIGAGLNDRLALTQLAAPPLAFGFVLVWRAVGATPMWYAVCVPLAMFSMGALQYATAHHLTSADLATPMRRLFAVRRWSGTSIREIAAPMLVIVIGLPLALQSHRVILSHLSSPDELAAYSIGAQLYSPLWGIVSTSGLALWAIFARPVREAESGLELRGTVLAFTAVGLALGAALIILGPALSSVISGGTVSVTHGLLASFSFLLVVQAGHLPSGMALTSPRGLQFQAKCVAVMLVLGMPMSFLLVSRLGAPGPVLASALAIGVCQWWPGYLVAMREQRNERCRWAC